jgi:hypothetical protein
LAIAIAFYQVIKEVSALNKENKEQEKQSKHQ